jgi:hypothetical protein
MIRIGFDPLFEAEQLHRELIKQVELYRLAQESRSSYQHKVSISARILALIGKGLGSLGTNLVSRYSDHTDGMINLDTQDNPSGCS